MDVCTYLFMLGLKLNHVSEWDPWQLKSFWCWTQNILGELGQYDDYWCPGSLCHHITSSHDIDLTGTTRTPSFWGYPAVAWLHILLSHIGSQIKRRQCQSYKFKKFAKITIFEFWNKLYTRHTFWSCLIRCANMKWIRRVLLKIQTRFCPQTDGRTDGRTDRGTDNVKPAIYPPFNFVEAGV